ncbi:MAG: PDC sensor domain-containing protein [bacterium]|nr:PDC sensor domain-containing protein [Candidatus Colisoma equi]
MTAIHRTAFGIFAAVVLLFIALAALVACRTSAMMSKEAERTMKSIVRESVLQVDCEMLAVETATRNLGWVVAEHLADPDYMYKITRELVVNNEYVVGSAVAFEPDFYMGKGRLFAPYTCVSTNGQTVSFPLPYEYPTQEWYRAAKESGTTHWCEPYFDKGGAEIMMCTFAVPLTNETGRVYAVLTADISLAGMTKYIASICPYPQSYAVMISCAGNYLVLPPQGRTFERNEETVTIREKTRSGWSIAIVCPTENILRGARRLVVFVSVFAVVGLLIIIPVSWVHISRIQREAVLRKWMESELESASRG